MSFVVSSIVEVSMSKVAYGTVSLQMTGQPNEPSLLVKAKRLFAVEKQNET